MRYMNVLQLTGTYVFLYIFFRVFAVDDALKQKEFMLKQMNKNEELW